MLSPLPSTTSLRDAGFAFRRFFGELRSAFFEREVLITQLELALLSREHLLIMGPPGTGKSALAQALLGRIVDERTGAPSLFSRQLTESTVQTDLIGPVNFKVLTETGRTEYLTDEGILGSTHALLDEVFDGRDMLLRSVLNALEEREVKGGPRLSPGQLGTAVLTSNRYLSEAVARAPELLLAVADRLAFTCFVPKAFARPSSRAALLGRAAERQRPHLTAPLTLQELALLQSAVAKVVVPPEVLEGIEALSQALERILTQEAARLSHYLPTRHFSARTLVKAIWALKAAVVRECAYEGKAIREARIEDLKSLRYFFTLGGPWTTDLEELMRSVVDARERQQLETILLEHRAFDEAVVAAEDRLKTGPEAERAELRAQEDFAAAEALGRSFQPSLASTLARTVLDKLVPGPRHRSNREAVVAAAKALVASTLARAAKGMAGQGEGRSGHLLWVSLEDVVQLVRQVPELRSLLGSLTPAIHALSIQALDSLRLSAEAVAFEATSRHEALAGVARQIELELREINRVWNTLGDGETGTPLPLRQGEEKTRAAVVESMRKRADALFAEANRGRAKLTTVGGEARRLRALEEALIRLHPSARGLAAASLAPLAKAYAEEIIGTAPFARLEQYLQAIQLLAETLRREGIEAGPILQSCHASLEARIREHAERLVILKPPAEARPRVEMMTSAGGEAYFHYREAFGPNGPDGELGALQRLNAKLVEEGVKADLSPDLGDKLARVELTFHRARVGYLAAWVEGVREALFPAAIPAQAKGGESPFDVLVRSRLPLLVLREGELVRIRGGLMALAEAPNETRAEAKQMAAEAEALSEAFRHLAERAWWTAAPPKV